MTQTNLFSVADKMEKEMTQFRAGFKAELYWGDQVTAHHMNTRSVYRFKENDSVSITHSAPYNSNDESVDQFVVQHTRVLEYHPSGNVFRSETQTIDTYSTWLGAYYCALETIRKNSNA